jgi:hypothetical protein
MEKEARINVFDYYADALMKAPHNTAMLDILFNDMRNEATFRSDVELRALAFGICKIKEDVGKSSPRALGLLTIQGLVLEKKIFDVLDIKERRELCTEALKFMRLVYEDWVKTYQMMLTVKSLSRQSELKEVENEVGLWMGFLTSSDVETDDLALKLAKAKEDLKLMEKEDEVDKPEIEGGFTLKINIQTSS